jgi:23S rRNA pseudouridine1911/1915/1917 synthase
MVYVDNHLLAVDKVGGMLTQASGLDEPNLEDWAREWVRVEKNKPGAVFLHAVHRLDRPVSGVVLFARTSKALSRLNESMRRQQSGKIYMARVERVPEKPSGELVDFLVHDHHVARIADESCREAKQAVLRYRQVAVCGEGALLEVELITGRYHQIRVQLSEMGCPIVGDARYGSATALRAIGLHHRQLTVEHPVLKESLAIEAKLPVEGCWS